MSVKLTLELRDYAIRWLVDVRKNYDSLEKLKNECPDKWNKSCNDTLRAIHSAALDEIERLKSLNDKDLFDEFQGEYQNKQKLKGEMEVYRKESNDEKANLDALAAHGEKFKHKKPKGSSSNNTAYIDSLVKSNPTLTAKALEKKADKNKTGNINSRTFANKVSQAKKLIKPVH